MNQRSDEGGIDLNQWMNERAVVEIYSSTCVILFPVKAFQREGTKNLMKSDQSHDFMCICTRASFCLIVFFCHL